MGACEMCSPSPFHRFNTARFGWPEPTTGYMILLPTLPLEENSFFISKHNCLRFLLMQLRPNHHLSVTFSSAGYSVLVGTDLPACSVGAPRLPVISLLFSNLSVQAQPPWFGFMCQRSEGAAGSFIAAQNPARAKCTHSRDEDEAVAAPADGGTCAKWPILRAQTCVSTGTSREALECQRDRSSLFFGSTAALKPGQRSQPTAPASGWSNSVHQTQTQPQRDCDGRSLRCIAITQV